MTSQQAIPAAILIGIAVAGCLDSAAPTRPPESHTRALDSRNRVEARPDTLRLVTRVESIERFARTGTGIELWLSVTSHERDPITLRFMDSCQLIPVVYGPHGDDVTVPPSCFFFGAPLTLEPGQTVFRRAYWSTNRYDPISRTEVSLLPGNYRVHASVKGYGYLSPPVVVHLR